MSSMKVGGGWWIAVGLAALIVASACKSPSAPPPTPKPKPWHLGIPIIDSHVHLSPNMVALERALEVFKAVGVGRFVVKSGGVVGSPRYRATMAMQHILGDKMRVFANLDFEDIDAPDYIPRQLEALEQMKRDGVVGIKIFKNFGLRVRHKDGTLAKIDEPLFAPIFETCGKLGLIVAWHVADPVAFFKPPTPDNERYEELQIAKEWSFYGKDYPSHQELIDAMVRVIERHPNTTFLLIHFCNYAENLEFVDWLLSTHKNVYTDVSARVPEIGRHDPSKVRALFIKHQDRILFGSDFVVDFFGNMQLGSVWHVPGEKPTVDDAIEFYVRHFRYFETNLKQIDHPTPIQGKWKVDAIDLPENVLRKFYVTNAERLIFSRPLPQDGIARCTW